MRARRILLQYTFSATFQINLINILLFIFFIVTRTSFHETKLWAWKWNMEKDDFFVHFTWMGYYWKGANFCLEVWSNINLKREVFVCERFVMHSTRCTYIQISYLVWKQYFQLHFHALQINSSKNLYETILITYELSIYILFSIWYQVQFLQ